jgi:hypothetical protein
MTKDQESTERTQRVTAIDPLGTIGPYMHDPKHKNIIIRTELGESPWMFRFCSIGARVGYFLAHVIFYVAWLALCAAIIYLLSQLVGAKYAMPAFLLFVLVAALVFRAFVRKGETR